MAASMKLKNREIFLRIFATSKSFSTTVVSRDVHKTSKMMQKFLQKKQRKKSHHWTTVRQPVIPQPGEHGKGKGYSEGMDKRMSHINRLFYETASQIVANGELDVYFDITKVKVMRDFSNVLIYWEATGTDEDAETEEILERKAGYLRSLMMKSNVLGRIPPVTFVKDKTYSRMMEIERLLKIAIPPVETSDDTVEIEEHGEISDISVGRVETITMSRVNDESGDELGDKAEINARLGHSGSSDTLHAVKGKYSSENIETKKKMDNEKQIENSDILADKINLRYDLYGIKHDTLMQKITNMKSSSRHRLQQPVDLATLKTSDSVTENVQNFDKTVTKKQRAENLKKYTEFFNQKTRKGSPRSLREEMEAVMTMNETKADIDQEYEYENDAKYELSGIKKYYIDEGQLGDGTDQGYYSDVESDDKEGTENMMENSNDSESNTDKPS